MFTTLVGEGRAQGCSLAGSAVRLRERPPMEQWGLGRFARPRVTRVVLICFFLGPCKSRQLRCFFGIPHG